MLLRAAIAGTLIVSVSCNRSEGGDAIGSAGPSTSGGATKPGSGGGFSADLAKELEPGSAAKAGMAKAGSDVVARPSSDVARAGGEVAKAGGEVAKAGGNAAAMPGDARPEPIAKTDRDRTRIGGDPATMPGSAAKPEPTAKAGSDAAKLAGAAAMPGSAAKPEPAGTAGNPIGGTSSTAQPHGPVKVPAELAAIKLSLLPNWDRDIDEAGTFQYVVRIKGTQTTKTFVFRYGYDDPKAPTDRDQYKKYLQDSRMLSDIKDRQRGSAWFLEGNDASGLPGFRYLIVYGGKRLICYGSLYKDADSNRLGDDRDQTVIQAKQICETLGL